MKNKISFTSVLKSKSGTRQLNLSSAESQQRQPRLIDFYQEFQSNPNKNYTLELNAFRTVVHRSRNNSIGMIKSNHTSEDPQMNLESWIQQTRQNYQSITKGPVQKSIKGTLSSQQQNFQSRRSRSNFNKNQIYPSQEEQQHSYQPHQIMENSKRYQIPPMEESQKSYQRNMQKPSLHYHSQQINQVQPQKISKPKPQNQQNSSIRPEEFLLSEQLKPKSHFPSMQDQDYRKLQEEFQRLKSEKINQLGMQTKKSVKREKFGQIISTALENIYQDIEEMAEHIIMQRKMQNVENKKNISQEEVSEEMLISGCNDYQEQQELNQSLEQQNNYGEEKRKQEMRNMIKGYISGIQEAKCQGKISTSFHSSNGIQRQESQHRQARNPSLKLETNEDESQEPSFNYQSNTFSNQPQNNFNNQKHEQSYDERKQSIAKSSIPLDSVGYSFANSNTICEHSFNKELMDHNNFQNQFNYNQQNHFNKNYVKPPVYEPQNSDNEEQQRISLPNIEEVKSDCGDFMQEQLEVESSEEIEFRRNRMQNITLNIAGNNIKNIESVYYEPPTESYGYQGFEQTSQRKDLFKHFEKPLFESRETENKKLRTHSRKESNLAEKDEILKEQNIPSHQEQKFVSKTFSSYLSGEMRSEYGHTIKEAPKSPNESSYSSKQSGFGYKVEPISRYSPSVNKVSEQTIINVPKPSHQEDSFHSISSPREQSFTKVMNNSINNQSLLNSNMNNSKMNESPQISMNCSMNQQSARQEGVSPNNIHQLQSKTKFSINSPMNKIEEMISNQERMKRENPVTQFNGFSEKTQTTYQFTKVPSSSNSYAVSSPIGNYKTNNSIGNYHSQVPQNLPIDHKYACAQSISSQLQDSFNQPSREEQNSILSMQPLKLSRQNFMKVENISISSKQSQKLTSYPKQRIAQNHENRQIVIETPKVQTYEKQMISSHISNGRTFLQSLHVKQSIEISLSPESKRLIPEEKASFVAQTFRPTMAITTQQTIKPSALTSESHNISSSHKTSITKITLRSSDKNQVISPKVISLSINQFPQKTQHVKQFSQNSIIDNKENVFEKLTIKESKNFDTSTDKKITLTNSIHHQSTKIGQSTNIQNHMDMNSKENNNTMNNSSMTNDTKAQMIGIQKPSTTMVTDKREPLLKLSKNFGNSTTQQSINVKKSIGESIRTKVHPPSSMANSKGISMAFNVKQSIKNVKQSIGNDSDMDFDLELD